jgi:hypothetical protein
MPQRAFKFAAEDAWSQHVTIMETPDRVIHILSIENPLNLPNRVEVT